MSDIELVAARPPASESKSWKWRSGRGGNDAGDGSRSVAAPWRSCSLSWQQRCYAYHAPHRTNLTCQLPSPRRCRFNARPRSTGKGCNRAHSDRSYNSPAASRPEVATPMADARR